MSYVLSAQAARADQQRAATELGRASYQVRLAKILCAVMLGICFWFSVPYYLPLKVDPDPIKAAANEAQAYEGNVTRQVAMPIILLIAAYMMWRLPKRGRFGGKLMIVALCYVGWAMVSFSWSEDPAISAKRLVVFAIDVFFAVTIARVFSMLEMALWGFVAFGTVALMSLYVDAIGQRIFAPFDSDYRFMGVMTANYQAMNLLVCILCGLAVCLRRPDWRRWIFPILAVMAALLFITRARIGTFLCIGLGAVMLWRMVRQQMQPAGRAMFLLGVVGIGAPLMIYALGRNASGAVTDIFMMGRKDTQNTANLSNRAPLWAELSESVSDKPWLGFGYEAFWAPVRVEKVSADQGWMVPNAHNTILDQALSLGIVGAVLYGVMMLGGMIVAWKRYRRTRSETDLLPALLLTWIIVLGLSESIPLDPYLPSTFAYICLIKMCLREGSEAESDIALAPGEIIAGVPPQSLPASSGRLHLGGAA
jgi:exopolysaccharide production protein ExoQ